MGVSIPTGEKKVNESADAQKQNFEDRIARLKPQIERMRKYLETGEPYLVSFATQWILSNLDVIPLVDGDLIELMTPPIPDQLPMTNYQ